MCDKKLFEQKIMDLKEYRTAVRVRMRTEENLEQYIETKKSPKAAGGGGSGAGGKGAPGKSHRAGSGLYPEKSQ